jgi:hypothetical protein
MIAAAAGTFAGHFASDIGKWYAEEYEKTHRDPGALAENHELRKLVVMAIEEVLDGVGKSEKWSGDKAGKALLENYKKDVRDRLVDAAIDPRFDPIWDQSITECFKPEVKDFAGKKVLSQEAWVYFLEPKYDVRVVPSDAALHDAATALHDHFLETLVGVYRYAFTHHSAIYVAVTTEILKKIWNSVSRIEDGVARIEEKLDSNTQALRDEIRAPRCIQSRCKPTSMKFALRRALLTWCLMKLRRNSMNCLA